MIIGVPKEVKIGENRVGLTDAAVQQLTIRYLSKKMLGLVVESQMKPMKL
jgi:alanine dehydrogenase